ncbi:MAG: hypothetical protein P8166_03405 [Candidatus Thiodiazotropha sp.]
MRKVCLAIFVAIFVSGCNLDEVQAAKDNISDKKVWAFIQFNVPFKNDQIEDYYYYGKISKPLYTRIKGNRIKTGFIWLADVKYWGNDDLIHDFADGENKGDVIFRIEDIRRMELVNRKPIAGRGREQFTLKEKVAEGKPTSPEQSE